MTILVFGSLNMDLVVQVPRFLVAGETLTGNGFNQVPGGKGANQAVAAARLGMATEIVGRVGADAFGSELLAGLQADGVEVSGVWVDDATHTGVALITVNSQGENTIVVIPGANGQVESTDVDRLHARLPHAQILMLQLEVPLESVISAASAARQAGVMVVLDPAPAQTLPPDLYGLVDVITPNQVEATHLTGLPVVDVASAVQAGQQLRQWGVGTAIVKLGAQGAVCVSATTTLMIPALPVTAVDTVAAGDAFNGGLATALAQGQSLPEALQQATLVAGFSVTRAGAQPSLPTQEQLRAFAVTMKPTMHWL
ncbi:MAG: ribokinase [Cyanobacteria bacterium]|nr:ribokinase [Cyanobacteriota bacterium]MDW8201880.1 ribokinase [Cyanobacteriota bacterium SKYGB_h_bin112]